MIFEATTVHTNPQEGARVGIIGKLKETNNKRPKTRFLLRHLAARANAEFSDFILCKINIEKFHFVGGLAGSIWIEKYQTTLSKHDWAQIAES